MPEKFSILILLITLSSVASDAQEKPEPDFSLKFGVEDRFFFHEGEYEGQERNYLSLAVQPEYAVKWQGRKFELRAVLFGRWDQHDARRSHADIRELYFRVAQNRHELSIGIKKIFWGVTEAAHVVNIINQTDVVESFDGEEKLGQPMLHYSYQSSVGTFDFFYMQYYRKPVYPGQHGRLRTPVVIDAGEIPFESDMEEYHPEVAFRWSHYVGKFDFGLSHFYGTSRQPLLKNLNDFRPVFAIINQTGLEVQATTGPMLWKLESVHNINVVQDYTAFAAGFEYTFGNVNSKGLDIGVLAEYLYDSRDELSFSSLQDDLFIGSRWAFNNTQDMQVLAGGIIDLKRNTLLFSIEASRRIKESWRVELEGRFFTNVSADEFAYFIRSDSFLKLSVNKYF